jgi:SAM-dependent methyltransferase
VPTIDYAVYRASESEQLRTASLLKMLPSGLTTVLEIGARDGHFSRLLTGYFKNVTALDLVKPPFEGDRITTVAGDVTHLEFADSSFDCVFCTEVLEHVRELEKAVREIVRVAKSHIVIGVPFRQDLNCGRLTCINCKTINPGWGHVNSFDRERLLQLFEGFEVHAEELVWHNDEWTNPLSTWLMDFGGNPWGPYSDENCCGSCGNPLIEPPPRNLAQKLACKSAYVLNAIQRVFYRPRPFWIHLAFRNKTRPNGA